MQKLVFTNSLGESVDLTKAPFGITNWKGLDNTKLTWQTQQVPNHDGSVYIDALMNDRDLSFTVAVQDNNNLELRYQLKYELIQKLNPKLGEGYLVYTNDYLSRRIKVVPQIPLFANKNSNDRGTLKASVVFTANDPYWEDVEETTVELESGKRYIVENSGDSNCSVKVDLYTGNVLNPRLINFTNDKKIELKGQFNSSISINTEFGKKSVETKEIEYKEIPNVAYEIKNGVKSNALGKYVGVSHSGLFESLDFYSWKKIKEGRFSNIVSIKDVFYLVDLDEPNILQSSEDGYTWKLVHTFNSAVNAIFYANNKFFALGKNIYYVSEDFANWDSINFVDGADKYLTNIVYNQKLEKYFMYAYSEAQPINFTYNYISTDGETWTLLNDISDPSVDNMLAVQFSEELDICFCRQYNTKKMYISTDGETWTESQINIDQPLQSVFVVEEKKKIYGVYNNYNLCESDDAVNWTDVSTLSVPLSTFFFVDGNFYGFSYTAQGKSTDFVDWETKRNYGDIKNIATNGNKTIYCTGFGVFALDGENIKSIIIDYDVEDCFYSEELKKFFVLVANKILSSSDGENFEEISRIENSVTLDQILYHNGKFIVIDSGDAQSFIYTSSDCENWTQEEKSLYIKSISIANDKYYIAGYDSRNPYHGIIQVSDDLSTWVSCTIENTDYFYSKVIYDKASKVYITIGSGANSYYYSIIATSENGTEWKTKKLYHYSFYDIIKIDELGLYFISANEILKTADLLNFEAAYKIADGSGQYIQRFCYDDKNKTVFGGGANPLLIKSFFKKSVNLIGYLTEDSVMSLTLEKGKNEILISGIDANFIGTITYRQRYIGV